MDIWGRNSLDTWMSRVKTLRYNAPTGFDKLRKATVTGDKINKGKNAGK